MSEMLPENTAFLLYQLSVDDYFDDDTFDAVVNDDSGRCEINIQDLAESAARHIGKLEAENAAFKARIAELEHAANYLRTCQKAYMAARGNEGLGKAVGDAASRLDDLLAKRDGP